MTGSQATLRGKVLAVVSSLLPESKHALVWCILFLLPTQLAKHLWPSWSFVYGVRVDYLSPALYLLDVLFFCYLVLIRPYLGVRLPNILFILVAVNILASAVPLASLVYVSRITLYVLAISSILRQSPKPLVVSAIISSMAFQLALSLAQVLSGRTLGGIFYWLGERSLSLTTPLVAKYSLGGKLVLRAYGTLSHPNVLAGWLVGMVLLVVLLGASRSRCALAWLLAFAGLLLTASRSAALSFFFFLTPFLLWRFVSKSLKRKVLAFYGLGVVLMAALLAFFAPEFVLRTPESFTQRAALMEASLAILSRSPLFGSGLGASIALYPLVLPGTRLLQPDHNSVLLALSQVGALGLAGITFWFFRYRPGIPWRTLLVLSPVLLFDHYLLTSTQGMLTMILLLFVDIHARHS